MYQKLIKYSYLLFCILLITILPLVLNRNGGIWVSQTYGHEHRSVELLGFSASLAWGISIYLAYKQNLLSEIKDIIWAIGFSMVYFVFLYTITDHLEAQLDYLWGYERAAIYLNEGKNPYQGTSYIYPPLLVEIFASILRIGPPHDLFYIYQTFQWLNTLLLFSNLYLIFKQYNSSIHIPFLPILIAFLMMLSVPLYRTLHFQQVNIILLNLILIGLLYADKNIIFSGLAFAIGIHLKIYPIIFGAFFLFTGRWKLCLSIGIWTGLIFAIQSLFFHDFYLYEQFWQSFRNTSLEMPAFDYFRNNSIRSPLIFMLNTLLKLPAQSANSIIKIIVNLWRIGMIAWVSYRCYHRHIGNPNVDRFLIFWGHAWDCIALMLLISPLLWEHHFVLCLPLLLAAFFTSSFKHRIELALSLILISLLPTFDVFLFSYHRIIGLIILLRILPIYYERNEVSSNTMWNGLKEYLPTFVPK